MKPLVCLSLAALMAAASAACTGAAASSSDPAVPSSNPSSVTGSSSTPASSGEEGEALKAETFPDISLSGIPAAEYTARMQAMYDGTGEFANLPTAEIETDVGTIKLRLFPAEAPKTVENFITHAKAGYYDGLNFHRIIEDFMIQTGDPLGTGGGGESIWGAPFEDEFSDYLRNFHGAISMANSGANTNGSQFFIVQNATPLTEAQREQMGMTIYQNRLNVLLTQAQMHMQKAGAAEKSEEKLQKLADEYNAQLETLSAQESFDAFYANLTPVLDMYAKLGGTPYLDDKHSVFGYVYEGMDVVDAIAKAEKLPVTDGSAPSQPKTPVKMIKVTIHE